MKWSPKRIKRWGETVLTNHNGVRKLKEETTELLVEMNRLFDHYHASGGQINQRHMRNFIAELADVWIVACTMGEDPQIVVENNMNRNVQFDWEQLPDGRYKRIPGSDRKHEKERE